MGAISRRCIGQSPDFCLHGRRIWQTVSPLICFDVVEFHHPDRVLCQFGQGQNIPAVCDTIPDIHLTDRRGRQNYDWAQHHRQFVDMWTHRCARIVSAPPIESPIDQSDPYMIWYRQITRLLIGNPASRPNTGYQGVGGAMEAMAQSLQKIYHRASDAMHQGHEAVGEHVLKEIQDICEYSLRVAQEDHRLTVRPDFCTPSTAAAPFIPPNPPKGQRGRPKKRGGYAGGLLAESRKRGLNLPGVFSTSLAMSYSPLSSNSELPETPQTWDSSSSAPEFLDITDQSAMKLDPEASETTNPIFDALVKIQGICSVALRMSNGNQGTPSTQDMVMVGPKTKRCKPRRRGGLSGSFGGVSAGANSYHPYTPEPSSPAPSVSLGHDGSRSLPHDISGQDVEPLVTPFSSYSPLPELQDNLQSEMIELDTITGSREVSPSSVHPSVLDLPCVLSVDENPVLPSVTEAIFLGVRGPLRTECADTAAHNTGEEENSGGMEVLPFHAIVSEDAQTPAQLDRGDPANFNKIPPTPSIDHNACQHPLQEPNSSAAHPDRAEAETEVKEPDDHSISELQVVVPPDTEIPFPSGSTTPAKEDSEHSIVQGGKRKGLATDDSSQTLERVVSPADPNALGKAEPVSVKEDGQKTYKRQRRSVPKPHQ